MRRLNRGEELFLVVSRVNMSVKTTLGVESFATMKDLKNNGMHWQLPGYVLVMFTQAENVIRLYHPETTPATGNVDVIYCRRDDDKISLHRNKKPSVINLSNESEVLEIWPDGLSNLLQTIFVIEDYLFEEYGVPRRLTAFVATSLMAVAPVEQ